MKKPVKVLNRICDAAKKLAEDRDFLFRHDLTLALGRTVGELMQMSWREERAWRRYIMIRGPIGEQRLDAQLAWIRQALFQSHGVDTLAALGNNVVQVTGEMPFSRWAVTELLNGKLSGEIRAGTR